VKNEKGLHVRIENLSFRYRPDEPPLINNFSAELLPGKSYCVTGKSGSGRSTLMKLITGLYDEFEGHIIINDLPLNSLNKSSLRRLTGDNFTESDVFLGSIEENIIAGRVGISADNMIQAAQQTGLHDFVEKLKRGYDTEVEPEGRGLSTTLRQLILLTRAVAGKPGLMLLEEQALPQEPVLRKRVLDLMMAEHNQWTLLIAATDPEVVNRCENQYQLT
jgi:ABC-type bacteriocin/lantibiotic exporter with double-glycine peptidase domain